LIRYNISSLYLIQLTNELYKRVENLDKIINILNKSKSTHMKFTSTLVIAALLGTATIEQINAIKMNQLASLREEPAAEATTPAATEASANTTAPASANATAASTEASSNSTGNATTPLTQAERLEAAATERWLKKQMEDKEAREKY